MRCSPYSHNTRPALVTSGGPFACVNAAALRSTLYAPPPTMSYCCYTVRIVGGHVATPIARHGAARLRTSTEKTPTWYTFQTGPLSVALKNTCALYAPLQTSPFPRARGPLNGAYLPVRRLTPGRLSRTPRRHAQGAILSPRAQMPRLASFASRSACASPISRGLYRRYHHASPAPTIARLQSTPAPFTTRTTSRPQASPANSVTSSGPTATNAANMRRAAPYPTCPISGASSPYRRPRNTTPYGFTKSTVSPSWTRFTTQ